MTDNQEMAQLRERIKKAREERGLSTDVAEVVEKYRELDPEYAEELGRLIGASPASAE